MCLLALQEALVVKNPPTNAGDIRNTGSTPGSGRSSGGGCGNPLQYSCLENPLDRRAWWATVHGISKSQTQLKWLSTYTQHQEKSEIFWYLAMTVTCLSMTVKSIYQSSLGYVPLVWMDLIWRPLRSLVLRLIIAHVGQISTIWLIILSCQGLPWPQLTSNKALASHSEFLDEFPWWPDKLHFGERNIAHVH